MCLNATFDPFETAGFNRLQKWVDHLEKSNQLRSTKHNLAVMLLPEVSQRSSECVGVSDVSVYEVALQRSAKLGRVGS